MIHRLKSLVGMTAAATLLAACATATPYQPRTESGQYGYAVQKLEGNRASVTFRGNSVTERQTVESYLLYRAAETTIENGFEHFIVVNRDTQSQSRLAAVGGSTYPGFYPSFYAFRRGFGWSPYFYGGFYDAPDYREITQFEAIAEIIMGDGPKPADNPQAFDARDVLNTLEPSIRRPGA